MSHLISDVRVIGLGKVGELVATLLGDSGFSVTAYDARPRTDLPFETGTLDVRDPVPSGPRSRAPTPSCRACRTTSISASPRRRTSQRALLRPDRGRADDQSSEGACRRDGRIVYAPQCGLAPGLIGIVGSSLTKHFDEIRSIELKVGALPRHPTGLARLRVQLVARGRGQRVPQRLRGAARRRAPDGPGHDRARARRHGRHHLEAALTSGGLGTMCKRTRAACSAWTTRRCATRATSS